MKYLPINASLFITNRESFVKQITSEQGSRQLYAPPPRFTGKITATHVNDRWAADVLDFQAKATKATTPVYVLLVQDIFSRFLFAAALLSLWPIDSSRHAVTVPAAPSNPPARR